GPVHLAAKRQEKPVRVRPRRHSVQHLELALGLPPQLHDSSNAGLEGPCKVMRSSESSQRVRLGTSAQSLQMTSGLAVVLRVTVTTCMLRCLSCPWPPPTGRGAPARSGCRPGLRRSTTSRTAAGRAVEET